MSWSFHGKLFRFEPFVEQLEHALIVVVGLAVDGEHARGFANAQHLLPGQLPMDIACQRGQIADILDMGFLVQYRLIEVGNAPTLGNVELEQIGELLCCLSGDGVSPGAKRDEQISILIECQIAVHHGAEADGANGLERGVVLLKNLAAELPIAVLQACPNIFEAVCPDAVFVSVFPLMASRCDRRMILADQHRLDASRAELDAKNGLSAFNCFLGIVLIIFRFHDCSPFHTPTIMIQRPSNLRAAPPHQMHQRLRQRKTMRNNRTHIYQPLRHQLDRTRVRMLHAAHQLDGQTLVSSLDAENEVLSLPGIPARITFPPGITAAIDVSTAPCSPATSNATSTPRPPVAARSLHASSRLLPKKHGSPHSFCRIHSLGQYIRRDDIFAPESFAN